MGRFLTPRRFVAIRAYDRHELGGKRTYEAKANALIAEWETLFSGTEPFRAEAIEDYIGGVWRDVST